MKLVELLALERQNGLAPFFRSLLQSHLLVWFLLVHCTFLCTWASSCHSSSSHCSMRGGKKSSWWPEHEGYIGWGRQEDEGYIRHGGSKHEPKEWDGCQWPMSLMMVWLSMSQHQRCQHQRWHHQMRKLVLRKLTCCLPVVGMYLCDWLIAIVRGQIKLVFPTFSRDFWHHLKLSSC